MKAANRLSLQLSVAFAIVLAASSAWFMMAKSGKAASAQAQSKTLKDPCWFMSLKDKSIPFEVIEERQKREMYGYPAELSLGEAIRIFNVETQCKALYKEYPPLTEDELIAAIVAGADYGKQGEIWQAQRDALWKIASQKVMPKGSLLVVESGGRVQESPLRPEGTIVAKGIRITLLLQLEKNEHGHIPRPDQTLIVRKTYSKVETVK